MLAMPANPIRPDHKPIREYYAALKAYSGQHVTHEGAVETAFSRLLADTAKPHGWLLIPKLSMKVGTKSIAPDGTLRDDFNLKHGYWEAKDTHAQNGVAVNRFDLTEPQKFADLQNDFCAHVESEHNGL